MVAALGASLELAGIRVWLDRTGIPGGVNYGPEIVAAIKASAGVVLCCSAAGNATPDAVQARALLAAGHLAHYQGDAAAALPWLEEGLALNRAQRDLPRMANAGCMLGVAAEDRGDYAGARETLADALEVSRAVGDQVSATWCVIHLGIVAFGEGNMEMALALGEEAGELARELGDADGVGTATLHLAHVACAQGEYARAAA